MKYNPAARPSSRGDDGIHMADDCAGVLCASVTHAGIHVHCGMCACRYMP